MQIVNKPTPLCAMASGKAIGAQKNFAATFNWMRSFCDALTEAGGFKIKPIDVVTNVEYDPESHELKMYREPIMAIVLPDKLTDGGEIVFTAVPLPDGND